MTSLSRYVAAHSDTLDASLSTLTCPHGNIFEVDTSPLVLALLLSKSHQNSLTEVLQESLEAQQGSCKNYRHRLGGRHLQQLSQFLTCDEECVRKCGGDKSALNYAICQRLKKLDISNNRLTHIAGLAVFSNLEILSLEGNSISTIEHLQPLCLLLHLRVLVVSGCPVALLPNYRSHVIRICCDDPKLFTSSRLRYLDGVLITQSEVIKARDTLRHEDCIMLPTLRYVWGAQFATIATNKILMHREMRRRGSIFVDSTLPLTLSRVLEMSLRYGVGSMSSAAHCIRTEAAKRNHLKAMDSSLWTNQLRESALDLNRRCVTSLLQLAEITDDAQTVDPLDSIIPFLNGTSEQSNKNAPRNSASTPTVETITKHIDSRVKETPLLKSVVGRMVKTCWNRWKTKADIARQLRLFALRRYFKTLKIQFENRKRSVHWNSVCDGYRKRCAFQLWCVRWRHIGSDRQLLVCFSPKSLGTAVSYNFNPDGKPMPSANRTAVFRIIFAKWKLRYHRSIKRRNTATLLERRTRMELLRIWFHRWRCFKLVNDAFVNEPAASCAAINETVQHLEDTPETPQTHSHPLLPSPLTTTNGKHCETSTVGCETLHDPSSYMRSTPVEESHFRSLAKALQSEKMHLVRRLFDLEQRLSEKEVQLDRSSHNLEEANEELSRLRNVCCESTLALRAYEEERNVHLAIIRNLQKKASS